MGAPLVPVGAAPSRVWAGSWPGHGCAQGPCWARGPQCLWASAAAEGHSSWGEARRALLTGRAKTSLPAWHPQNTKLTFLRCAILLKWEFRKELFGKLAWGHGLGAENDIFIYMVRLQRGGDQGPCTLGGLWELAEPQHPLRGTWMGRAWCWKPFGWHPTRSRGCILQAGSVGAPAAPGREAVPTANTDAPSTNTGRALELPEPRTTSRHSWVHIPCGGGIRGGG